MTQRRRRPAREALLIVCEGRETEPRYFELLTRALGLKATVDVEIRGDTGYTDPRGLVDAALKLQRDRAQKARSSTVLVPFDEVWVVFDLEDPSNGRGPAVTPAVQYALSKKLRPVLSRPSFEVWYILHDRPNPPGVSTSADCVAALRTCAGDYGKSREAADRIANWALSDARTQKALTHGHRQDVFEDPEAAAKFHIPNAVGTAVHRLVQRLVDMCSDDIARRSLGILS